MAGTDTPSGKPSSLRPLRTSRLRLVGHNRVAINAKGSSVWLAMSTFERVDWLTDSDVDETGRFDQFCPACTRQATGDSTSPQIDLASCLFRYGLGVRNVGELQGTSRAKHAERFGEDRLLVRAQVDHAVGDYNVGPLVLDR
jgi:hypothetical protein